MKDQPTLADLFIETMKHPKETLKALDELGKELEKEQSKLIKQVYESMKGKENGTDKTESSNETK